MLRQSSAEELLKSLHSGTAHTGALISGPPAEALGDIIDSIDQVVITYRGSDGLALPITAFVPSGRKK